MAWVGLGFYTLHAPAILTAMAAGRSLLRLQVLGCVDLAPVEC
jgi:hypothetical protein